MKLTFLGATGTVTGSKYLIEDENKKFLVDCGLFQGLKELRERNWQPLPVNPADIDAVILTHAHIDHSGYLPLLVKNGFKGRIYCSAATMDLCSIMLPDSGHLHEEDAERANRYGYSKHKPALPLYTEEDAYTALEQFKPVEFGKDYGLSNILSFQLGRAGHILGAATVTITDGQTRLTFSGDLGRPNDPIMKAPAQIQDTDYLVLESTYGDRRHIDSDPMDQLCDIINEAVKRGGSIIIPAFAVGRAQILLYYIHMLKKYNRISRSIPVFLDSPMAISATQILKDHDNEHRLSEGLCEKVCAAATYTRTPDESKTLNSYDVPIIIISASGMATGGRVLHHLKHYVGDPRNAILFTGYQAAGTRGARMVHGEDEVKIHGELYPVRAQIDMLDNISAHADYEEIFGWLDGFTNPPRKVFLTHGEPEAASTFQFKIEERLEWNVTVPEYGDSVEL